MPPARLIVSWFDLICSGDLQANSCRPFRSARQYRQQRLVAIHQQTFIPVRSAIPGFPIIRHAIRTHALKPAFFKPSEHGEQYGVSVFVPA